jgi:hypothetical protein
MNRRLSLLVLLGVLIVGASGCATSGTNVEVQSAQEGDDTRVYEVFGMNCPGCHGGLEKLAEKIPTVQQATADWKAQQLAVTVRQGADLDDEDIYDAIRRADLTAGERIQ